MIDSFDVPFHSVTRSTRLADSTHSTRRFEFDADGIAAASSSRRSSVVVFVIGYYVARSYVATRRSRNSYCAAAPLAYAHRLPGSSPANLLSPFIVHVRGRPASA